MASKHEEHSSPEAVERQGSIDEDHGEVILKKRDPRCSVCHRQHSSHWWGHPGPHCHGPGPEQVTATRIKPEVSAPTTGYDKLSDELDFGNFNEGSLFGPIHKPSVSTTNVNVSVQSEVDHIRDKMARLEVEEHELLELKNLKTLLREKELQLERLRTEHKSSFPNSRDIK